MKIEIELDGLESNLLTEKDFDRIKFAAKQIVHVAVMARLEAAGSAYSRGIKAASDIYSPKPIEVIGEQITEPDPTELIA